MKITWIPLEAVAIVLSDDPPLNVGRLSDKLSRYRPVDILRDSRSRSSGERHAAVCAAEYMRSIYTRRMRKP